MTPLPDEQVGVEGQASCYPAEVCATSTEADGVGWGVVGFMVFLVLVAAACVAGIRRM